MAWYASSMPSVGGMGDTPEGSLGIQPDRRRGRTKEAREIEIAQRGEDRQVRPTFKEVDEDETSEELWRLMDEALNGKDANLCPMETMPLCPSA